MRKFVLLFTEGRVTVQSGHWSCCFRPRRQRQPGLLAAMVAVAVFAQAPSEQERLGSISGVVKNATGQPVAGVIVTSFTYSLMSNGSPVVAGNTRTTATTDPEGRYKIADRQAGRYLVSASDRLRSPGTRSKRIHLRPGHHLESVDFAMPATSSLSGKVLDENKEPMAGVRVYLVSREYFLGSLGNFIKSTATTNDKGEYVMDRFVQAGRPYLVMADSSKLKLEAVSEAPAEPKLRKKIAGRTFYPDADRLEAAVPVLLRSGERRENIDITMLKAPSLCIEGSVAARGAPAVMHFSIAPLQPTFGQTSSGGMYGVTPGGQTGPDGKFRICELAPGAYRISTHDFFLKKEEPVFGATEVTILERDLRDVAVVAGRGLTVPGSVVFDGPPPESPIPGQISIWASPLTRATFSAESEGSAGTSIPGEFKLESMLIDDYNVRVMGVPSGFYVKDVLYANRSVKDQPLHLGTAIGDAALRIVLARDGGTASVLVADKDNHPVSGANIVLLPAGVASEAMVPSVMISGETDQEGTYTSPPLPPGKYLAMALDAPVEPLPASVSKLWRSRGRAKELEISSGNQVQLNLRREGLE
jgi:hypothetical protein